MKFQSLGSSPRVVSSIEPYLKTTNRIGLRAREVLPRKCFPPAFHHTSNQIASSSCAMPKEILRPSLRFQSFCIAPFAPSAQNPTVVMPQEPHQAPQHLPNRHDECHGDVGDNIIGELIARERCALPQGLARSTTVAAQTKLLLGEFIL